MTSLLARAALVPLLLAALGCGTDAPPLAPPTRTLEGGVRARYLTGTGPVEVADAPALARLTADGFVADAYWAFTVEPRADGFAVQGVPDGTLLYLRYAGPLPGEPFTPDNPLRYVVLDADAGLAGALDVRGVLGRPDAPGCDVRVWGALQVEGSGIVAAQRYHLVSPDVAMVSTFEPSSSVRDPQLPLTGAWRLENASRGCPRASAGDRTFLFESMEQRTTEGRRWQLTRASAPLAVTFDGTLVAPEPLRVALPPQPVHALGVERAGFLTPVRTAGVPLGGTEPRWRVALHAAHAPEGVVGPLLLEVEGQRPFEPPPLDASHLQPLGAPWETLVTLSATGPFGEVGRRVLRSRLEAGPVVATLAPPEGLEVEVGSPVHRLTWQAPRLGTAAWYDVAVFQEVDRTPTPLAHFLTRDTSLRLPPDLLAPGIYIVQVTARAPERAPADLGARSQALWAEGAWASTPPLRLLLQ